MTASQYGEVLLRVENVNIHLRDALLVPSLRYSLLSTARLDNNGIESYLRHTGILLKMEMGQTVIGVGKRDIHSGTYTLSFRWNWVLNTVADQNGNGNKEEITMAGCSMYISNSKIEIINKLLLSRYWNENLVFVVHLIRTKLPSSLSAAVLSEPLLLGKYFNQKLLEN